MEEMDEKQAAMLDRAISKLTEQEQEEIAAAGAITDKQCDKLKYLIEQPKPRVIDPMERSTLFLMYGGKVPKIIVSPKSDNVTPDTKTQSDEPVDDVIKQ